MTQTTQLAPDTVRKLLERDKYCSTAYEVLLSNGEHYYRVGYTRKSGTGLRLLFHKNADAICDRSGQEDWRMDAGKLRAAGWTLYFSGRTYRDAIANGVYPSLAN